MKLPIRRLAAAAVVAAAYAALSFALAPISFGPVQFRVAEALCVLPFFMPFTAWGLFAGCVVSNLLSAYGPLDVIFGSAATLAAALCTARIGKMGRGTAAKALACLPPVVLNGVVVGAVIAWSTASRDAFWPTYLWNGATVALGELAVLYAVGLPLLIYLPRAAFFKDLTRRL